MTKYLVVVHIYVSKVLRASMHYIISGDGDKETLSELNGLPDKATKEFTQDVDTRASCTAVIHQVIERK